ncbi:MAG: hypothetical protein WCG42_08845 [Parachlamydiaceae bacterium]
MKFFNKIIASGMLLASVSVFADLPQPYVAIHNLPATPYYVQDAYIYYNLVNSNSQRFPLIIFLEQIKF